MCITLALVRLLVVSCRKQRRQSLEDWPDPSGVGALHQEGRSGLHDGHGRVQPRAHAHLGVRQCGGRVMRMEKL